ncbi:CRISPR-associated endonuclease Cas3'' [Solidesulfovibrio sp. C21]|uniref:CRISPR-associated endonuclease Cas3'' n=1 Tax=Solidesulfovibrio sp. C21 TaxID=3398613 RepID=UPI0039FD3F36
MPEECHWFAHSVPDMPQEAWQTLPVHLSAVAARAKKFAAVFGAAEWGYLAGLWHDAGKYTEAFQRRLAGGAAKVDHSTAGAKLAVDTIQPKNWGKALAYCIAGHHAGLPDGKESGDPSCLTVRLRNAILPEAIPDWLTQANAPQELPFTQIVGRSGLQAAFFIRMLYSCLVDADFLDTESFLDTGKQALRGGYPPLEALWERLQAHLDMFKAKEKPSPVDPWRNAVLGWCLEAAEHAPGLFSLTVPTGGGKTLSSLAFALKHAVAHRLDRVIYVIPYTSIIEQNADVFREAVGTEEVIEHHSNFDPLARKGQSKEDSAGDEVLAARHDLACENWDAPLVVTTSVQFFESLFAARSSRCRKLHNIAKSVVILDEAQMLPPRILRPCMEALRALTESYGTTVVLCTATQPALTKTDDFSFGLDQPVKIVSDVDEARLFSALKRTRVEHLGKLSDEELAARLVGHTQVLCVVNCRRHARMLRGRLGEAEGVFHLSASMCPVHRSRKLADIRAALKAGRPCRVVSTTLIECGVDISFPVVYRAKAGIDSVAQASGRCNREGELPGKGVVYVFEPVDVPTPGGDMARAAAVGAGIMRRYPDVLSPEAVEAYFRELYWMAGKGGLDALEWDRKGPDVLVGIVNALQSDGNRWNFPFRKVADAFQFITSCYRPVIIPWDEEGEKIVAGLRHAEHAGKLARRAQRYTVQIPPWEFAALEGDGVLECVQERFFVLGDMRRYDDEEGLFVDVGGAFRAADWIQ